MNPNKPSLTAYFPKPIKYFNHQLSMNDKVIETQSSPFRDNKTQSNAPETERKIKPLTVFEKLYQGAKERINRLTTKIGRSVEKDKETSFTPNTNRKRNRHLESDMIERGEIWMEMKKKAQMNNKQQEMLNQMKDCTFSPKLNEKACKFYQARKQNRIKVKQMEKQEQIRRRGKTPRGKVKTRSFSPVPFSNISARNIETPRTPAKIQNIQGSIIHNLSFNAETPLNPISRNHANSNMTFETKSPISKEKYNNLKYEEAKRSIRTQFLNFNI